MFRIFKSLFLSTDTDVEIVHNYLRILKIPISKNAVREELLEHPDSQSLLSVSDTLTRFGVENAAAKVTAEQLDHIQLPFMARMKSGDGLSLAIVKQFDDDLVIHMPSGQDRWVISNKEKFLQDFQGIVIVGVANEEMGQPDYAITSAKEAKRLKNQVIKLLLLPILIIVTLILALFQQGVSAIIPVLYTIMVLVGTIVGSLLLWYETDRHSVVLQKVCRGGKRRNCDTILNSKASNIFGISWALIGFSYFAGALLAILMLGVMNAVLFHMLSILSLIALVYTVYSVYYQWRVAKQWCVFCLWAQGVLVIQAILVILDGRLWVNSDFISPNLMLTMATSYAIPFWAALLIVPVFKKVKEGESYQRGLARLKHNQQLFQALLIKQRAIIKPTDGLGIRLGKLDAKHKIIKVCNPYCGPCANAHPVIDNILQDNPDVQVQIIFTSSDDDLDIKAAPVRHLLALFGRNNERILKQALNDWYLAKRKDYAAFAAKYPMNGELKMQGHKIRAMQDWCEEMDIHFTPTFFVDGYQLPLMYTVEDLKYFRWSMIENNDV